MHRQVHPISINQRHIRPPRIVFAITIKQIGQTEITASQRTVQTCYNGPRTPTPERKVSMSHRYQGENQNGIHKARSLLTTRPRRYRSLALPAPQSKTQSTNQDSHPSSRRPCPRNQETC